MVIKMASTNGGSLAVLTGLEAGNGSDAALERPGNPTESSRIGDGDEDVADGVADHSDDEQGADMGSEDSDSMDFDDDDDDDDGSDLMSNTTLGDDITAQLAAAGNNKYTLNFPTLILMLINQSTVHHLLI